MTWRVELRLNLPRSDADIRFDTAPMVAVIDPDELPDFAADEQAYGRALGSALLDAARVGRRSSSPTAAAQGQGVTLRVRLLIGPSASRLHALRWETLRSPRDGSPLLTDENIVFSRYLSSMDWRPVGLRPRSALRALVVVAGPSDVDEYGSGDLAPVDVADEIARAREGLRPIPVTVLGEHGRATEERLFAELHDGADILYLVCHGYRPRGGDPILLLERRGRDRRAGPGRRARRADPGPAPGARGSSCSPPARARATRDDRHSDDDGRARGTRVRAWPRRASPRCSPCRAT